MDGFCAVVTNDEIASKHDFNLSPARVVAINGRSKVRELPAIKKDLDALEAEAEAVHREIEKILTQLI